MSEPFVMPYPIGATVYIREGYRDSVVEAYEVLGYNIRKWGVDVALIPIKGSGEIFRRTALVYGTQAEAERNGA